MRRDANDLFAHLIPLFLTDTQVYYMESVVHGVFNGWLVNQWSGGGYPLYVRRAQDGMWWKTEDKDVCEDVP